MISQIMPNTKLLQEMKSRMPIGLYVNSDEVSEFLIANPFGFQTPFYILNDAFQSNEFVIVGNAEFSRNLVDWYPVEGGRLTLSGRDKMYIRYKGDGEVVEIVESQYHYSIGGNLFSLTRKEWGVDTPTQEVTNGTAKGEFEQYFMNQTNLIHARLLMLAFKTDPRAYNQLFKGCVNLEDIPVIVAEECQSATYSSFLSGCAKVSEIRCNITQWQQYTDFSLGLPAVGTFYKRESAVIPEGKDGIPEGWEIVDVDVNHLDNATPFWIKNLSKEDTNALMFEGTLQYSWDAKTWEDLVGQSGTIFPQQKVFIRTKPASGTKVKITASTQPFEIGGNLFSLTRDEWDETTKCNDSEFKQWFASSRNLKSVKNIIFPKILENFALAGIFSYCDNLNDAIGNYGLDYGSGSNACNDMYVGCNIEKIYGSMYLDMPYSQTNILAYNKRLKEVTIKGKTISAVSADSAFLNCTSLSVIRCFVDKFIPQQNWVKGVAERGTFYKYRGVEIPIGTSGIPRNWEVVEVEKPSEPKPLNPNPYGNATPFWVKNVGLGENEIVLSGEYQYSINGKGWSEGKTPILKLAEGQRMFIRTMPNGFSKVKIVSALRGYEIGGNLFSLTRDEWSEETACESGEFARYFIGQIKLIHANNIILPLILNTTCCSRLFEGCINLENCPKIIAKTYQSASFAGYLTRCNKINEIYVNCDNWGASADFSNGVAPQGTFYKRASAQIPTGKDGIPDGWDVVLIEDADTQPINA